MKKYFMFALAAATMASCSNDEFLGEGQGQSQQNETGAILFTAGGAQGAHKGVKRKADHVGADAASMLNKKFVVGGYKGGTAGTPASLVTTSVFDHYSVEWAANTAGTTASNTADWEYAGKTIDMNAQSAETQEIKYWDYSVGQYDFIAYSSSNASVQKSGKDDAKLTITQFTPSTAKSASGGAYTVYGQTSELQKFYIADLVTAYNPTGKASAVSSAPNMGDEVKLTFRNLTSKVRIGFYETIPGYSVRSLQFFTSDTDDSADNIPVLYSGTTNIYTKGTYTVYFPTVDNKELTDYNKAHVAFAAEGTQSSTVSFGSVNANRTQTSTKEATTNVYLNENSNQPTWCGTTTANDGKGVYTAVLPNETATALTLRVNYTLVSNDGSKETINVYGAKAVVPAEYCQWKSNYAYTYIFKISDNTNGCTDALNGNHAGLTPITFDAVVVDDEEHTQQTITTVATPSITTYQNGRVITADEYDDANGDIYVTVQDHEHVGAILNDLSGKDELYEVTDASALVPATEANVMDALNMGSEDGSGNVKGRNGLTLTKATLSADHTSIPGADGNAITKVTVYGSSANEQVAVSKDNVAKFTPAAKTYAYVYKIQNGSATTYNTAVVLTEEPSDWSESDNVYYTDFECTSQANVTYADGTYYKLMTNNNNKYAVKVIKVQ